MRKEGKNIIFDEVDFSTKSYDELSQISRDDHQEDTHQYDNQQNALCLVMIGAICFVCSILFLLLSFERKMNKMAGLQPASLQFVVCVACFVAAAALLTVGLTRFYKAHKIRKSLHEEIIAVNDAKKTAFIESK